jgi:hypothetical protein
MIKWEGCESKLPLPILAQNFPPGTEGSYDNLNYEKSSSGQKRSRNILNTKQDSCKTEDQES